MKSLAELKPTVVQGITPAAYALGDMIGQLVPIDVSNLQSNGGMSIFLMQLDVTDTDKLGKKISLYIFSGPVTLPADNAAFDIALAADVLKLRAKIDITTWLTFTNASKALNSGLSLTIPTGVDRKFYVAVVAGEALTIVHAANYTIEPSNYID